MLDRPVSGKSNGSFHDSDSDNDIAVLTLEVALLRQRVIFAFVVISTTSQSAKSSN